MNETLKSKMSGLFFFAMSDGEYSDYGVNGFYVCDHAVNEAEWHEFCRTESALRAEKRAEIITTTWQDAEHMQKSQEYRQWLDTRGTIDDMFAAKHGMIPIEYDELHHDF